MLRNPIGNLKTTDKFNVILFAGGSRVMELSALENQKILKNIEQISVSTLFYTVYESKREGF